MTAVDAESCPRMLRDDTGDDEAMAPAVGPLLAAARLHLGLDLALLVDFAEDHLRIRAISGDSATFGLTVGDRLAFEQDDRLAWAAAVAPDAVTDTRASTSALPLLARSHAVGAYAAVALRRGQAAPHGALICLGRHADRSLAGMDLRFLAVLADLVVAEIEAHGQPDQVRAERRRRLEATLEAGGPSIVFQPVVALQSRRVVGAEALARFASVPTRGPEAWFADAWQLGLGVDLELASIRSAVAQIDSLPRGTYLALNASPETLLAPGLGAALDGIAGERLVIELTEHTAVDDYEALANALARLRSGGVRLAIDDAGAGFASMRHILRLRPDVIKLDLSLTRDVDSDPVRQALAAALVNFASNVGASITAEGIETAREIEALRALGVEYGQGFYLGHPGPPTHLLEAERARCA